MLEYAPGTPIAVCLSGWYKRIRSAKYPWAGMWRTVRNRNTFAIHGSGVPFPDVLSGNCCMLDGTLRTSNPPLHSPPSPSQYAPAVATVLSTSAASQATNIGSRHCLVFRYLSKFGEFLERKTGGDYHLVLKNCHFFIYSPKRCCIRGRPCQ